MKPVDKKISDIIISIEQKASDSGNATTIEVMKRILFTDNTKETHSQVFNLNVIPYEVALSLCCQIVDNFKQFQSNAQRK